MTSDECPDPVSLITCHLWFTASIDAVPVVRAESLYGA